MDLKLWKDFSSLFPVVLLLLTFVSQTFANEFQMTVTINPPSTTKGSTVVLTCDFTLINERDLHLLYWETTNGERIYTYNHVDNTNSVHTNYQNKVVDYNYEETGGWSRRHTLKLRVNNCDRATYQCLVLNQEDFAQGSDQKTLEIKSYLPAPTVSMEIDGKSYSSNVYKENTTSITISCTVTNSSVRPDIVLLRGDTDLKAEASVSDPVECLHSGVLQSGDIVVEKDSKDGIFYCQATYGTTPVKSDPFGIVFSSPCDSSPCQNGGTCNFTIEPEKYECLCPNGYYGDRCEINPCEPNPCFNGGTCQPVDANNRNCLCVSGYYGDNCQTNPCAPNPCQSGGTCQPVSFNQHSCACLSGYYGSNCQTNPCDPNPCSNGGTCTVIDATRFECACLTDHQGDTCGYTACVRNQCNENSTCVALSNVDYECRCQGNQYGSLCVQTGCEFGACYCRNGGSCVDRTESCYCECDECYTGDHCDQFADGDLCSGCVHESSCQQTCDGTFTCHCDFNWNGTLCDQKCNIALGTSSSEGSYSVDLGGSRILSCRSENPSTSVVWVRDGVAIATRQTLAFSPALRGDEGVYRCTLRNNECRQQLEFTLSVQTPIWDVELVENETAVSNTSANTGEKLLLNCSVAKTNPLPWLYLLKLTDSQSNAFLVNNFTIKEILYNNLEKYAVLSNSSLGNVTYQVDAVAKEDEGYYACVATRLDYQQTLKSVLLLVPDAGGTEKCSGFLCEEWKIILTCLGALMVLAIIIVVIVVLLKKSNAFCTVSHLDSVDGGKKPLDNSAGDIEAQTRVGGGGGGGGGTPVVRSGSAFDVEVKSLDASSGPAGPAPLPGAKYNGKSYYENPAMNNTRSPESPKSDTTQGKAANGSEAAIETQAAISLDKSRSSRLTAIEVNRPVSSRPLPSPERGAPGSSDVTVLAPPVMTSSSVPMTSLSDRHGRLLPLDVPQGGEELTEKKRKKKKKKKRRKEHVDSVEDSHGYDNNIAAHY